MTPSEQTEWLLAGCSYHAGLAPRLRTAVRRHRTYCSQGSSSVQTSRPPRTTPHGAASGPEFCLDARRASAHTPAWLPLLYCAPEASTTRGACMTVPGGPAPQSHPITCVVFSLTKTSRNGPNLLGCLSLNNYCPDRTLFYTLIKVLQ